MIAELKVENNHLLMETYIFEVPFNFSLELPVSSRARTPVLSGLRTGTTALLSISSRKSDYPLIEK